MPPPLDVNEESVQVPDVSQPSFPMAEILGAMGIRPLTPRPDDLVGRYPHPAPSMFLDPPPHPLCVDLQLAHDIR